MPAAIIAACAGLSPTVRADVAAGVSIGDGGVKGFYLAVGDFYKVPERDVVRVRERRVSDDELPVVFFLAARAHVSPDVIIDLRIGEGRSWLEIGARFGLGPDVYYVPLQRDPGPPYGKAYGYYKNHPRKNWGEIKLSDADIVNLVNLKFISGQYGYSTDEVAGMRARGDSFVGINGKVKAEKARKTEAKQASANGKGNTKANTGQGKKKQ
jgi:hypothetical protein